MTSVTIFRLIGRNIKPIFKKFNHGNPILKFSSTIPLSHNQSPIQLSNNNKPGTFNPYKERIDTLEKEMNNEFTNRIRTPASNEYLKVLHKYLVEYYPPDKF